MNKNLSELLNVEERFSSINVKGLTSDSRDVRPGYIFAALPGAKKNGKDFICEALNKGAVAVIAEKGTEINHENVILITSENPRSKFAKIASLFYKEKPDWIGAVTGTNGKTSVANFTNQIWRCLNLNGVSLGTLGVDSDNYKSNLDLTTPEPVTLHKQLSEIASKGCDRLVLEASSHGLDQSRLDGIQFNAAAFTNLSHDHLDYHKNFESYKKAKLRLFRELINNSGTAILNRDNENFNEIFEICKLINSSIITYGSNLESDIRLVSSSINNKGQEVVLNVFGKRKRLQFEFFGKFQIYNVMCALGLVISSGCETEASISHLEKLKSVNGRLELIAELPNHSKVFIDYAHTPAALENVLLALKSYNSANLALVFGCGGDRDQTKREIMGNIASKYANKIYVTDDNPRSENPKEIRRDIMKSCSNAIEIGDRAKAINVAVSELDTNDILLIAGKGHETNQIYKNNVKNFDDRYELKKALKSLGDCN